MKRGKWLHVSVRYDANRASTNVCCDGDIFTPQSLKSVTKQASSVYKNGHSICNLLCDMKRRFDEKSVGKSLCDGK